jgi:hypothetical protein
MKLFAKEFFKLGKQQVLSFYLKTSDFIPYTKIGCFPVYKMYMMTAHDHMSTALLYEGWCRISGAIYNKVPH